MPPELRCIDHIHLTVSNPKRAAAWYQDILGFNEVASLAFWNEEDVGPLTIADQSGKIHLALFQSDRFIPSSAIAFQASGEEFIEWRLFLQQQKLLQRCVDHTVSWSLYFEDPDNNNHEITTFEHEYVLTHLLIETQAEDSDT